MQQIKQEIDRKMAEKDEEMDNARKNAVRTLEQIQGLFKIIFFLFNYLNKLYNNLLYYCVIYIASLDNEIRARGEAIRSRKKMESDLNDIEVQLARTQRLASEAQKGTKDFTLCLKECTQKLDDSQVESSNLRAG